MKKKDWKREGFDKVQITYLVSTSAELDTPYADINFNVSQMRVIKKGMDAGVDVRRFAIPQFSTQQMGVLLSVLLEKGDISSLLDPGINATKMIQIVETKKRKTKLSS